VQERVRVASKKKGTLPDAGDRGVGMWRPKSDDRVRARVSWCRWKCQWIESLMCLVGKDWPELGDSVAVQPASRAWAVQLLAASTSVWPTI
jgi:hypothetical protein